MAARLCLADLPLVRFIEEPLVPYEEDEVMRLILDEHNSGAFREIRSLTVGDFRNWLLSDMSDSEALSRVSPGITPEMAAAVSRSCATRI